MKKTVIIMRGISGSGKSTRAKELAAAHDEFAVSICSADDFFMRNGVYEFRRQDLAAAHAQCLRDFVNALWEGVPLVIVDNTNTRISEFQPYARVALMAGYEVRFEEFIPPEDPQALDDYVVECARRNQHGLGYTACLAQANRFVRQGRQNKEG